MYFSLIAICSSTGMILESILAIYYHWKTISAIMTILCIINFLTLFFVPEPSIWLRTKGKIEQADKVDKWFDLKQIHDVNTAKSSVNTTNEVDNRHFDKTSDTKDIPPYWLLFIQPSVWKPTLILLLFYICQQGTGLYVLLFYTMDVLREFRIPYSSNTISIVLSVSRLLGSLSFSILHWCKKRTLVMISGGFTAGCLIVIVIHTKMFKNVENPPYMMVLLLAFILYMFFALLGILTMPWILSGELYPIATKGK